MGWVDRDDAREAVRYRHWRVTKDLVDNLRSGSLTRVTAMSEYLLWSECGAHEPAEPDPDWVRAQLLVVPPDEDVLVVWRRK